MSLFLGIDVGTSGCRAVVIDGAENLIATSSVDLPTPVRHGTSVSQQPRLWWQACRQCIASLANKISLADIKGLAIDATSATVLITDKHGNPLTDALMYNDSRATEEAQRLNPIVSPESPCRGAQASLAKAVWLLTRYPQAEYILHQADWLSGMFLGSWENTDSNNVLKLGYDIVAEQWPDWMCDIDTRVSDLLCRMKINAPGTPLGTINAHTAVETGLAPDTVIYAGTTDSTAAFIASGAQHCGDAMTSLGSTLVIKIITDTPIFDSARGVYSHRLGDLWLTGGASNSGGAVLKQYFDADTISKLSVEIDASSPSQFNYYPLCEKGERFPINDPQHAPAITPRPNSDAEFLHGLLEGIANIEHQGYTLLHELGAPYPETIRTVGKGAGNTTWSRIRKRLLCTTLLEATQTEAAYGSALLAKRGYNSD